MVAIDATLFGALVWGSILLVLFISLYELYAVLRDAGVLSGR
jgi:hypothetical protein